MCVAAVAVALFVPATLALLELRTPPVNSMFAIVGDHDFADGLLLHYVGPILLGMAAVFILVSSLLRWLLLRREARRSFQARSSAAYAGVYLLSLLIALTPVEVVLY